MFNLRGTVSAFAFDPNPLAVVAACFGLPMPPASTSTRTAAGRGAPSRILCQVRRGIARTSDSGRRWTPVYQENG